MMKKRTLLVVLSIIIFAFVCLSAWFIIFRQKGGLIVNEKTVKIVGEKYGFDMEDPDNFGRQVRNQYKKFSPERSREAFCIILSRKEMPGIIKFLPPDLRKEAIGRTAEWLKDYRLNMTNQEKEKLREMIRSPEKQAMVKKAKYAYFEGYNAEERAEIAPLVEEMLNFLSEL